MPWAFVLCKEKPTTRLRSFARWKLAESGGETHNATEHIHRPAMKSLIGPVQPGFLRLFQLYDTNKQPTEKVAPDGRHFVGQSTQNVFISALSKNSYFASFNSRSHRDLPAANPRVDSTTCPPLRVVS
jgi:hypothetical protein